MAQPGPVGRARPRSLQSAPEQMRERQNQSAIHLGYALAVLLPPVGLLVGVALIARGDEDGPWVVTLAVAAGILYTAVVAGRLSGVV